MKKRLLSAILLASLFHFSYGQSGAVTGPAQVIPCSSQTYSLSGVTPPTGLAKVCSVQWEDGGYHVLQTTTGTQVTLTIPGAMSLMANITFGDANCSQQSTWLTNPFPITVYPVVLSTPAVPVLPASGCTSPFSASTTLVTGPANYVPPAGAYSVTWNLPSGWSNTPQALSTSITPDANSTGNISATATLTACPYSGTSPVFAITRSTPTLSFSASNPSLSCSPTQDYSINPTCGATSFNYSITQNAGVYFTGTANAQSLTTTATTVNVTFPSTGGSFFLVVSPNYPNGTTGPAVDIVPSFGVPQLSITPKDVKIVGMTVFAQTNACPGCTVNWAVNGVSGCNSGGGAPTICEDELATCGKPYIFTAIGTNACGTTNKAQYDVNISCSGGGPQVVEASVLPNPTQGSMKVSLRTDSAVSGQSQQKTRLIRAIRIVDKTGRIIKRFEYGTGVMEANITTEGLSKDIYILQVFDGSQWTPREIIVK